MFIVRICIIVVVFICYIGCNTNNIKDNKVVVNVDSIVELQKSLQNSLIIEKNYYNNYIDSIVEENNNLKQVIIESNNIIDSINEELLIAKYKLERINYYNTIAKNGNNIKFLRGWINRVLKD